MEIDYEMRNWYQMSGFLLLGAWLYGAVIICVCTVLIPIVTVVFCTLLCKSQQQRRLRQQQLISRFSIAKTVIGRNKKLFSLLSAKAKESETCIICMSEFKESDEVSELNCDERHVFHAECIEKWLQTQLKCPICKREVKAEGRTA